MEQQAQVHGPSAFSPGGGRTRLRSIVVSLVINAVCPFLIYKVLKDQYHASDLVAIVASGVPSLTESIVGIARHRRIDVLAGVVLLGAAVSVVLISLGGSAKLYLVRESFFTAAFGLAYLVSLLFPKSLAYYFARQFMVGNSPEGLAWFDGLWEHNAGFRSFLRRIGLVWSIGLLVEAAVRTALVLTLTTEQFLVVSPFVLYGMTGGLIAWSFWTGKRRQREGEEAARRRGGAPDLQTS